MTREQFINLINKIDWNAGYPWKHDLSYLRDHDAEQRAVIERLDQLTTMQDGGIRSLHEQIVQKDAEITALKAQLAKTKGKTVRTVTTYGAYEDPI